MTHFNLAGEGIKSKKQLTDIKDAIAYYASTGTEVPNPLKIYPEDYRILAGKVKTVLRKNKASTENLELFWNEVEIIC